MADKDLTDRELLETGFGGKQIFVRDVNLLFGFCFGFIADAVIREEEQEFLTKWRYEHADDADAPLLRPVFAGIDAALANSVMTLETVCLLSKLKSKEHIEIEVKMDEMDLTSAESKATYEEIREYVLEHTGLKVSQLYIAQVKQKYGIIERENYNKPKSENAKQPQCPPEKEKAITEALKRFGRIL